jgi:hypothetical protein
MLLINPTSVADFIQDDGKISYGFKGLLPRRMPSGASPWSAALTNNATLLEEIDSAESHPGFLHGPKMFDIGDCAKLIERWPVEFERTRQSRFRRHDNVALEALLPQYLVSLGRAAAVEKPTTTRSTAYLGLENVTLWNRYWLWRIETSQVKFLTLNDNFGAHPNLRAVRHVRQKLEDLFSVPSAYEARA